MDKLIHKMTKDELELKVRAERVRSYGRYECHRDSRAALERRKIQVDPHVLDELKAIYDLDSDAPIVRVALESFLQISKPKPRKPRKKKA